MFGGRLDDLALFSRTLSPSEVALLAARTVAHFSGLSASNTVTVSVLLPEAAPLLSAPSAKNGWSMAVSGPAGATYTVFASTNLISWTPLETLVAPPVPFQWNDLDAANHPRRFYRILIGP